MKNWDSRPNEIASLLNPAFLSHLISEGLLSAKETMKNSDCDFLLPFISVPLVLHPVTRKLIPEKRFITFKEWVITKSQSEDLRGNFAEYAADLVPFIKEALIFGMQHGLITITDDGRLNPTRSGIDRKKIEVNEYITKIRICSRWLADSETLEYAMQYFGVKP